MNHIHFADSSLVADSSGKVLGTAIGLGQHAPAGVADRSVLGLSTFMSERRATLTHQKMLVVLQE